MTTQTSQKTRTFYSKFQVDQVLEHPQTIPFLGGEDRAQRYLTAHAQAYNTKIIDISHEDDSFGITPLARFLQVGHVEFLGLIGNGRMDNRGGNFSGVRERSAKVHSEK